MTEDGGFTWSEYLSSIGMSNVSHQIVSVDRNEVVRVHAHGGRELLFKRGRVRTSAGDGSLLTEGLTYQLMHEIRLFDVAPRCIMHDRQNDVLAIEYIDGSNARDARRSLDEDPEAWALLGAHLAQLHSGGRDYPEWAGRLLGEFDELVPRADPLQAKDLVEATPGQIQTLRTIQADPLVGARLAELAQPTDLTLIHADARLDNFIVGEHREIRLVDFELSRVGDPLYDLGSLLASVIENTALGERWDDEERASLLFERIVRQCRAQGRYVVAGYRAAMRQKSSSVTGSEEFLWRLASFSGVHLLHRSGALAHHLCGETRMGRFFAVMGCAIVKNPSVLLRPLGLDATHAWLQRGRGDR